jgi:carbonic anhydrase
MSVLPDLLAAAEQHAITFTGGRLQRPPTRGFVIVTCIDARIDPDKIFALAPGDANVIRNAGGRTSEAIRSLVISQELLGTREIVVLHHTDCGLHAFTTEEIRTRLATNLGPDAGVAAAEMDFLSFTDREQTLREDVAFLRTSPLLRPETEVTGLIYDVWTGSVKRVE